MLDDVLGHQGIQTMVEKTVELRSYERAKQSVGEAIAATDDRKLKAWVAVAVWEEADGSECETVMADDHSTNLELKAYLHDGVWMAAHTD